MSFQVEPGLGNSSTSTPCWITIPWWERPPSLAVIRELLDGLWPTNGLAYPATDDEWLDFYYYLAILARDYMLAIASDVTVMKGCDYHGPRKRT